MTTELVLANAVTDANRISPPDLVRQAIRKFDLAGSCILAAVSGGADSVALLRILHLLAPEFHLNIRAAHLDHGLRSESEQDAHWTEDLCRSLGIPLDVERQDVGDWARQARVGIEEAAREARYAFLKRLARKHECSIVAVAHTADDRIETVLHHVLRGTGVAGLVGIRPIRELAERIHLVRPLVRCPRTSIEAWLKELGQSFRVDPSNADLQFTRNRIRHVLLPNLERDFGPQVRDLLLRLAEHAEDLQRAIEELARRVLSSSLLDDSTELCRLDAGVLQNEPPHLVREALVLLWKRKGWPRQEMGSKDWERLFRLVHGGGTFHLPGRIEASRRGGLLAIRRR